MIQSVGEFCFYLIKSDNFHLSWEHLLILFQIGPCWVSVSYFYGRVAEKMLTNSWFHLPFIMVLMALEDTIGVSLCPLKGFTVVAVADCTLLITFLRVEFIVR